MILSRDPISVPWVFFISFVCVFSLVLSSMYYAGFSPFDGNPMMN
jgi:hypothetical protein